MFQYNDLFENNTQSCFQAWRGKRKETTRSILINPKLDLKYNKQYSDQNGRIVAINFEVCRKKYVVINIYGPNQDDTQFICELIKVTEMMPDVENIIIGGDFNFVLNPEIDRKSSMNNHHQMQSMLTEFMEKTELCDIWRIRNPNTRRYTWFREFIQGKLSASRIDFYIISNHLCASVEETNIEVGYMSDHSLIEMKINISKTIRGPGVWKFNNQFLENEKFQNDIKNIILDVKTKYDSSEADILWRELKISCINYSKTYGENTIQ